MSKTNPTEQSSALAEEVSLNVHPDDCHDWRRLFSISEETFDQSIGRDIKLLLAGGFEGRGQMSHSTVILEEIAEQLNELQHGLFLQSALKTPHYDYCDLQAFQRCWAENWALPETKVLDPSSTLAKKKIKVAFHNCWWDSSTMRGQALPFIKNLDREKFEVIGLSFSHSNNDIADDLVLVFDKFYHVSEKNHRQLVNNLRELGLDIFIETTGFSPFNRYACMGDRFAMVQAHYLNHTCTSEIKNVDYIICDKNTPSAEFEKYTSEKVYRLQGSFFCFNYDWDYFPPIKKAPFLQNGYLTIGCFGSETKFHPVQLKIFAQVLNGIDDVKLILMNHGLSIKEHVDYYKRVFEFWDCDLSKVDFISGGSRSKVKKYYQTIDLSLDTWPYNGGNTIAESLWSGVPVYALQGSMFAGNYGSSLLRECDLEDYVCSSVEELVQKISKFTKTFPYASDRGKIREHMKSGSFGDPVKFANHFGDMLEDMVKIQNQRVD